MTDKKETLHKAIEETLACSAFAEAGEPCPLGKEKASAAGPESSPAEGREKSALQSVEDDLACTAFYDENEECPIDGDKKEKK